MAGIIRLQNDDGWWSESVAVSIVRGVMRLRLWVKGDEGTWMFPCSYLSKRKELEEKVGTCGVG